MSGLSAHKSAFFSRDTRLYNHATDDFYWLVELPELGLFDSQGRNRASVRRGSALISKQVLLSSLQGHDYDARLVNLKEGGYEGEYGEVEWGGEPLSKVYIGRDIHHWLRG